MPKLSLRSYLCTPMRIAGVAAIAVLCLLAGGCSSKITMMPTPVILEGGRTDLFNYVPPEKRSNKLEVFYATERGAKGKPEKRDYNNDMGKTLRLGEATVQFGSPSTTWEQLVQASTAKKREKKMTVELTGASEIGMLSTETNSSETPALTPGEREFADQINRALEGAAQPEVSIYVHGFRVDFEEGVAVAAELRHYLGRRHVMIAYAWPCRQGLLDYGGDVSRAIKSGPNLARLIEFIAANTKAQHINLLGYSAGATLLVEGLVCLRERHAELDEAALQKKLRVGNVVLVAADVDLKHFVKSQLEDLVAVPQFVEITVSRGDKALLWSKRRHLGTRLGRASAGDLSREQVEEVAKVTKLYVLDVTKVKGPHSDSAGGIGGHGYWYANPWVLSDTLTTFIWQLPPGERGLVNVPGKKTWTFPDDYPERINAVLAQQLPMLKKKLETPATPTAIKAGTER